MQLRQTSQIDDLDTHDQQQDRAKQQIESRDVLIKQLREQLRFSESSFREEVERIFKYKREQQERLASRTNYLDAKPHERNLSAIGSNLVANES